MIAFFYIYLLLHTIATIAKTSCELNMKDFFICMLHVRLKQTKKTSSYNQTWNFCELFTAFCSYVKSSMHGEGCCPYPNIERTLKKS